MTTYSIPSSGLQSSIQKFDSAASRIARDSSPDTSSSTGASGGSDSVSLSSDAVALLESKNAVQANINAVRAEDQVQQSLLNILA